MSLPRIIVKKRQISVFINCPFDTGYRPVLDAIVFATVCCGFLPRSALETGNTSVPRIVRITNAMFESKYSIHDLSRCRGEGDKNIARFNMPLELGMAMALRMAEPEEDRRHDWLVLVPKGHIYQEYVSDLAGFDPKQHDETKESVIPSVMSWLATRKESIPPLNPTDVMSRLPVFEDRIQKLRHDWKGEEPWFEILREAADVSKLETNPNSVCE
jgi:hypothetical protein